MQLPSPLSHAYIITGGNAASRAEYARRLSAAYVCGESVPCGRCLHCEKAHSGIHPDVISVSLLEDKREIVADQARALRTDAYVRPN